MASSLLLIAILGIGATLATEIITWVNKKLNGTVLAGKGAFLLAIVVSFLVGIVKVAFSGTPVSWETLGTAWAQVFAASQVVFLFLLKWLNLDVKEIGAAQPA